MEDAEGKTAPCMNGRKDRLRCNSKLTAGGGGSGVKLHRCGHGGEERDFLQLRQGKWGRELT